MAVKWMPGCAWQLLELTTEPNYKISGGGIGSDSEPSVKIQENLIAVWARPMAADSGIPASPVNPGAYSPIYSQDIGGGSWSTSNTWICLDRGASRTYGEVAGKMYYETWQFSQGWREL